MLFSLLAHILIGASLVIFAVTVDEFITKKNLPHLIRKAFVNPAEEKAKKLLAQALNGKIHELDGNTISISLFDQNGTEEARVKLTGTGISSELKVGMTV